MSVAEPAPAVGEKIDPRRVGLIRLTEQDLDRPLHRIYPLWFLEDALRVNGGRLVLVPPSVWEDPFEDIGARFMMQAPSGAQKSLAGYLAPVYAQCWSFEDQSDVLMRAYSRVTKDAFLGRNIEPRYEGVRVTTTPRKLIKAAIDWLRKRKDLKWSVYLGAIDYRDDGEQMIVNRLGNIGPTRLGIGIERVQSVLIKRKIFRHESEVRLVCVLDRGSHDKTIWIDVNPNELFHEMRFDPRLAEFERLERVEFIRSLGYKGTISEDRNYQLTIFCIPLPKTWDELDASNSDV